MQWVPVATHWYFFHDYLFTVYMYFKLILVRACNHILSIPQLFASSHALLIQVWNPWSPNLRNSSNTSFTILLSGAFATRFKKHRLFIWQSTVIWYRPILTIPVSFKITSLSSGHHSSIRTNESHDSTPENPKYNKPFCACIFHEIYHILPYVVVYRHLIHHVSSKV